MELSGFCIYFVVMNCVKTSLFFSQRKCYRQDVFSDVFFKQRKVALTDADS